MGVMMEYASYDQMGVQYESHEPLIHYILIYTYKTMDRHFEDVFVYVHIFERILNFYDLVVLS